jgi:hypothetical protein
MPPLVGVRHIRNYIACVAHGSVTGAIDIADTSRLLYRAQVALSTRRIRPTQEKAAPSIQKEAIRSHFRATKRHSGAISRRRPCRLNPYTQWICSEISRKIPATPPLARHPHPNRGTVRHSNAPLIRTGATQRRGRDPPQAKFPHFANNPHEILHLERILKLDSILHVARFPNARQLFKSTWNPTLNVRL